MAPPALDRGGYICGRPILGRSPELARSLGNAAFGQTIRHDHRMGSAKDKPRKRRHSLPKVPKYEEPNTLPLPGLTGNSELGDTSGRFGHGSDGKEHHAPGLVGRTFLKVLGMRRRDPEAEDPVARRKED